jgi:hypothetical protein
MLRKSLLGLGIAGSLLLCVALASAEVVQQHGIRASFQGTLTPRRLPLHGEAPVRVSLSAKISGSTGSPPPFLRRIEIAINRHGRFEPHRLPVCRLAQIQPTTNADALRACGRSLVGEGQFSAQVGFTGQAPFPARGKVLAFNGTYEGAPAILAHVYGTHPAPTSYTVPFVLGPGNGEFGTVLEAELPDATGTSGYITGISLSLGRTSGQGGAGRPYLSAECPVPGVSFTLARARLSFVGGKTLVSAVQRDCEASG